MSGNWWPTLKASISSRIQTAVRSYLNGVPGNSTPPTPSQSPTNWNPLAGKTQDLGSVDAAAPAGFGGSNYAQGGLDAMAGADAAPLSKGGANYAAGGLDSGADTSIGGGGMTPQMGSALASGIGQIGSAISKAYAPIKLGYIPPVQQVKPLVFGAPSMSQ